MSNICIELGRVPPVGTPLFIKLGVVSIQPPAERQGTPAAMWNITAAYATAPNASLQTFPQGFAVAYSVSADELPSAVHGAVALGTHFNLNPQRIMAADDLLTAQIPDLNAFLVGDQQVPGQEGTGLRQPAVSSHHTMPWFVTEILKIADALPKPEVVVPVPTLVPGELKPLTPTLAKPKATLAKAKPKAAPRKKRASKVKATAASS